MSSLEEKQKQEENQKDVELEEGEIEEESPPTKINKSTDTTLELQLGDVINITNPLNDVLNNKTFIIDYIDKSKVYLINVDTMDRIRVSISEDGIMGDGNITKIAILSRSDSASYAEQNGLLPGKWVNIHFEGDYPVIITGEISNLENDMIEIKTIDNDVIYLNFDYKGLPEDLPINLIEIREKPIIEEPEPAPLEELNVEKVFVNPEEIQINVQVKNVKDQLREFIIKADQVKFGDEDLGPIVQYVDVSSKIQRYSIETQVSDLLDELLSRVPNSQRTNKVLNNFHTMIERFKQLREHFSHFDQYGNIEGSIVKEASYKPLMSYFTDLNINLYWIMPVIKNIKKIYTDVDVDEENNDVINIKLYNDDLKQIKDLFDIYKANNMPIEQNKYSSLYSELNKYLTPFDDINEEAQVGILTNKYVETNINTTINNLEEMYSSIYSNNALRSRRFVIEKYNTSLTKLTTIESSNVKSVNIRTNITNNDLANISSFITLPEPVIRFSKINLPGTSILDKANLNLSFINYWQLLKKKTNINTIIVDDVTKEIEFNEANFSNNIKNFVLNVTGEHKDKEELYKNFIKTIIPRIKVIFNLMKKYITGKLSIVDVVSYLEPFLIYTDDLTFNQYREIIDFIDEEISKYNKKFIERSREFKSIGRDFKSTLFKVRAFSVIENIKKNMQNEVIQEGYDMYNPTETFTNSEILQKITLRDNTKLYTSALSVQNIPLMFPTEFSNLFDEEKMKLNEKLKKDDDNKCKAVTIAKYYGSIEELNNDNDKLIYFDKKYDKTNYSVLEDKNGYEKEVLTMSPEDLHRFIQGDLMRKKQMSEIDAEYLATTLVDGQKKVIDGQVAILYKGYKKNASEEIEFYIRKNNKWEVDPELNKDNINTDDSTILCDIQDKCISVSDNCESMPDNELMLQTNLLTEVIGEFDSKYKVTREILQEAINSQFDYNKSIIALLTKIETNNLLKNNNYKYKIGSSLENEEVSLKPVSPYQRLLNLILMQDDFVKTQKDIIKFTNTYTREAITDGFGPLNEKESTHWLYCIKTGVKLLPCFVYNLADTFVTEGQYGYLEYLEQVKTSIGRLSDDGDLWCDKYSGWTICPVDFSFEEGYEEGFKVSTRAIMEEDAGNKIMAAPDAKKIRYITPEAIMINNIVNTLSFAMGINMESSKEFIINGVITSIKSTLESENDYKLKVTEMAEKGKKIISYKDLYNTAILFYTFGLYLIAIQTSIPEIKTRKTHPGCIRSFSGYPYEGVGNMDSLNYLACVAYDIRESGEPWNILKGKKIDIVTNKIKASIDSVLLQLPEVLRRVEERTAFDLTRPATDIPSEHDIANWTQFLPPLVHFKIKHLAPIPPEFKKALMSDLRSGSINQRTKLLVVSSKIIQYSLSLIEIIQDVVKKNRMLFYTANNEPYLENACCESKENQTTIDYFVSKNSKITEYNAMVSQLSNLMDDIFSYSKAGLFYCNINSKNKYPAIVNEFNEKTIYMIFIHFCKFKNLLPIPDYLLPYCTNKPESNVIRPGDSIDIIIQKLKDDGRNYNNEMCMRLLQAIGQHNIIPIKLGTDALEISSLSKISDTIMLLDDELDDETDKTNIELIKLMKKLLDTFDIATDESIQEVKDLNNFLIKNIATMKGEIKDFIQENKGVTSRRILKEVLNAIDNLSKWSADESNRNEYIKISDDKLYNIVQFYKNYIDNFTSTFPNIILNSVNYNDNFIPAYYGFSLNHKTKLKKSVADYYEKLTSFYGNNTLDNILNTIKRKSKQILDLSKTTPCFSSIKLEKDRTLKPIFDERTSRFLYEYYLLSIFINYVDLSDEPNMITMQTQDTGTTSNAVLFGNKKGLKQKTAELLIAFISIMSKEKDNIDISYEDIQDRIFKLKEREKNIITDRLKGISDEARDADTALKAYKLGAYNIGLQSGLTMYDEEFYDKEQNLRDQLAIAERNIRKQNRFANDENIDILLDDFREEQGVEEDIEREAYDMEYMNETYYDGNTDGVGAPEEEYQDYEDEY
jgi:hypothetical protein